MHDCGADDARAARARAGSNNDVVNFREHGRRADFWPRSLVAIEFGMFDAEVLVVGGGPAGSSIAFALARAGVDVHARRSRALSSAEAVRRVSEPRSVAHSGATWARSTRSKHPAPRRSRACAFARRTARSSRATSSPATASAAFAIAASRCDAKCSTRFCSIARAPPARRSSKACASPTSCARTTTGRSACRRSRTDERGDISARLRRSAPTDCARSSRSDSASRSRCAGRAGSRSSRTTRTSRDVGEHGEMHVERDGYVGIADVGNGLTTVALVVPAVALERDLRRSRRVPRTMAAWRARISRRASRDAERATPVVATGPFASHARRAWAPGAALVGDAADFFDPFTGEGIYSALRGGEMLASSMLEARRARTSARRRSRASPRTTPRAARSSRGKWIVERVIGAVVGCGAADQSRRAQPLGAQGPRRSAHRRHRRLRAGDARSCGWRIFGRCSLRFSSLTTVTRAVRMIDSDTFRSVLGRFASGVTVVTARDDDGGDHGMTVSAFCSVSLEPPLVLFCVDHAASMHELLLAHPTIRHQHSRIGAGAVLAPLRRRGRPIASTASPITRGESGVVLLDDALAHLECRIVEHHEAGDHTIFIAEVERADAAATTDGRCSTIAAATRSSSDDSRRCARVLDAAHGAAASRSSTTRRRSRRSRERSIGDVTRSNTLLGGLRAARASFDEMLADARRPARSLLDVGTGLGRHPGARRDVARASRRTLTTIGVDEALVACSRATARASTHGVCAQRARASLSRSQRRRRDVLAGASSLRGRATPNRVCAR